MNTKTNPYDIDGTTISPFFIMDNRRMKFMNVDGSQSTGSQILKLFAIHDTHSPTAIPNEEFRKRDLKEQIRLAKIELPYQMKFWTQWVMIK